MINRRGFLRLLAGVAVTPKRYFFAPIGGWRSDVIINPLTCIDARMQYIVPQLADNVFKESPFLSRVMKRHLCGPIVLGVE